MTNAARESKTDAILQVVSDLKGVTYSMTATGTPKSFGPWKRDVLLRLSFPQKVRAIVGKNATAGVGSPLILPNEKMTMVPAGDRISVMSDGVDTSGTVTVVE